MYLLRTRGLQENGATGVALEDFQRKSVGLKGYLRGAGASDSLSYRTQAEATGRVKTFV